MASVSYHLIIIDISGKKLRVNSVKSLMNLTQWQVSVQFFFNLNINIDNSDFQYFVEVCSHTHSFLNIL